MIAYVKGTVAHIAPDAVIVETMGIGYRIYTMHARGKMPVVGQEAKYYTYLNVREDAMQLYGFATTEEHELFLLLISVSGIGPKVAMGLLSATTPPAFCQAIRQKHLQGLTALPGIGKKTAERLIVELKDKLGSFAEDGETLADFGGVETTAFSAGDEAVQALLTLGFAHQEATLAVKKAKGLLPEGADVEAVIKQALKVGSQK